MKQRLLRVQERLEQLEEKQQEELLKDERDQTTLEQLRSAIAPLAATEQNLLNEWKLLEGQPEGEHWGTAPDAGWQVNPPCVGPMWPEYPWAPEFPGSCGGCCVHLLDLAAPAEVEAMHATGHQGHRLRALIYMLRTTPCRSPSSLQPRLRLVK